MPPRTRITDILSEYDNLQCIFEYGFDWKAEAIAKKIWNRKSQNQTAQQLNDEKIWENIASVVHQEGKKGQKSNNTRKLVNKNHYRMQKNQWIPYVYGMYGMKTNKTGEYEYEVREDRNFKKNASELLEDYFDSKLAENSWTEDKMIGPRNVFKNKDEYKSFLRMFSFFVEIAPLSTLGYNFLRRLDIAQRIWGNKINSKYIVSVKLTNPYIIVRNPFIHDGLEQESIFRCLYAINHNCKITMDGETYIPEKVEYKGNGFEAKNIKPYVKVRKEHLDAKEISQLVKVSVDFYYNDTETLYLRKRRRDSIWNDEVYQKDAMEGNPIIFKSPYYKEEMSWKTDCVTYEIPIEELDAFEMFIRSFGDFAHISNKEVIEVESKVVDEEHIYLPLFEGRYIKVKEKSDSKILDKKYSLCNAYNSNGIFENIDYNKLKIPYVKPTQEEEAWVRFVLQKYPNFVKMF